jgi:hypothetical protein
MSGNHQARPVDGVTVPAFQVAAGTQPQGSFHAPSLLLTTWLRSGTSCHLDRLAPPSLAPHPPRASPMDVAQPRGLSPGIRLFGYAGWPANKTWPPGKRAGAALKDGSRSRRHPFGNEQKEVDGAGLSRMCRITCAGQAPREWGCCCSSDAEAWNRRPTSEQRANLWPETHAPMPNMTSPRLRCLHNQDISAGHQLGPKGPAY